MARARQSYAIVVGNLLSLCSIEPHVKSLDLTPNFLPMRAFRREEMEGILAKIK
jgi:hypothetical protein